MKFVTIALAVVFNLSLLLMYSRGLVGGGETAKAPAEKSGASRPRVEERSASSAYEKKTASAEKQDSARVAEHKKDDQADAKEVLEPVSSGDGKETIDPKDGKETIVPVAENVQALRLRSSQGAPSTELFPRGSEIRGPGRGILGPANPANVDPPVVSPEAR